jgi:hypothetical protein
MKYNHCPEIQTSGRKPAQLYSFVDLGFKQCAAFDINYYATYCNFTAIF